MGNEKSDYGLHQVIKDFRNCMFCEILDQFYNGEKTLEFTETHQRVLDCIEEYVLRGLHSYLFRKQSLDDEAFVDKTERLKWVTPG